MFRPHGPHDAARAAPYGYQPAAYYDPSQGAAPQQLGPVARDADGRCGDGYPDDGTGIGSQMEGEPCQLLRRLRL